MGVWRPQDVSFHWDKDYSLEDAGVSVHPLVATVTYLSDGGAPTVVVPHTESVSMGADIGGRPEALYLSRPRAGKHIAFDGRFLHAAPAGMTTEARPRRRVTLLVNVWLNHVPVSAVPLPPAAARAMSDARVACALPGAPADAAAGGAGAGAGGALSEAGDAPTLVPVTASSSTEAFEASFGEGGGCSISVPFPASEVKRAAGSDCLKLQYDANAGPCIVVTGTSGARITS